MPSPKKDEFLQGVITHIKFPFDREDIRAELESHISEKMDYYIEQGHDIENAEQLAVNDMGDAEEIGVELNKQHNPFLGWIWKITNVMVVLLVIWNVYTIGVPLLYPMFKGNPVNDIPKSDIVYRIDIDEKVKLDDTVIHFTNVIYEKDGDLNIFYEHYDTRLWGMGWSLGSIGEVTDNLGNKYFAGSGYGGGGIISRSCRIIENFPKEAEKLIISYDSYNRKYTVEIPLQAGDDNEQN
ncbi:MAG: hypothetical protein K0R84_531 [Clostridia bacterium]|jgi:hypothetical protein|nr:hypothetical protein [Clostridia bacterium]